jgi:MGT family glycosyltransferase
VARFLFTVWPFPGHVHPNIAIAHALRERGHEVAFYTGSKARAVVEGEGFRCFPFEQIDEARLYRIMFSRRHSFGPWKHPFRLVTVLRRWLLETIPQQVTDLQAVMATWLPDVVVSDVTFWGPFLVLHETCRVPVAVSSFVPGCMIPGPDAPPWGLGLPRPRNWRTRLLARLVGAVTDLLVGDFRRTADALRKRYGLSPLSMPVHTFLGQMPLYLVPGAPEFDYERRDLPPSVQYIGSVVWNKPHDEPLPTWLAELPTEQPWVHVTEGTMHAQAPIVLRAAAQGLANLPMQVIMTTGRDRDPAQLGLDNIAPNVRVERWVSHADLLPRTDVLITTGGGGTVMAALSAGVPMVVVPTQWEKPDNAQRVAEAGAGIRLSPRRCTPRRLREAVEQVLKDPSFRQNVLRLAAIFERYGGAPRAAQLLEVLSG